jgi:hypothetical protein
MEHLRNQEKAHRLTCLYKIINGQMDINPDDYIKIKPERNRRGHDTQFVVDTSNTDSYANSFFPRTIRVWNTLSQDTIDRPDPPKFKSALYQNSLSSV